MIDIKFSINTLGCKTNLSESDYIIKELSDRGFKLVKYSDGPDFCIINTCTVTSQSDRKVRQIVRRIKSNSHLSTVIVTGCYAVFNEKFLLDSGVDCIVKNKDKYSIPSVLEELAHRRWNAKTGLAASSGNKKFQNLVHSRALVKIQDGCEQNCSYCIIPKVRGGYRSTPDELVLAQIRNLAAAGFDEVVLTGIHIGKYAVDINAETCSGDRNASDLADLLEKIIESSSIKRIRLGSIEISEVDSRITDLIRESGRIAPHLHIPLQSGSDKILELMKRPYSSGYFLNMVESIKKSVPDIAITTDVIVGFPRESEEDFIQTVDLIKKVSFSKLHVFKYSRRMHTEAYSMGGQVAESVKSERSKFLREIGSKLRNDYIRNGVGKFFKVVTEKVDKEKRIAAGTSENYVKVYFPLDCSNAEILKKGKLVEVKIESVYEDGLIGKMHKTWRDAGTCAFVVKI